MKASILIIGRLSRFGNRAARHTGGVSLMVRETNFPLLTDAS